MRFDSIIIGGGLSGLTCGIRLAQQGQRCVIVSSGQSALHFSSGSFDLLNALPNKEIVNNPVDAVSELGQQSESHPYSKMGASRFKELARQAKLFFNETGLALGGEAEQNHYRVTPLGTLTQTWLSMPGFAISDNSRSLPWKKVGLFFPIGFLDYYPRFIADELLALGTESNLYPFTLPGLDYLRRNPSEMRATNIARVLDKEENIAGLLKILKDNKDDVDAIFLPACMGLNDANIYLRIEQELGKPVRFIPAMPPSIAGIYIQQHLQQYFTKLGGVYMQGDNVMKADLTDNKVVKVYSYNHGDIPFTAENIVLATGSYFSQGLVATSDTVCEPIFNLDVSYQAKRSEWYREDIFEKQPYRLFGVKTDNHFRGLHNGEIVENLFVAGAILEGFDPIKEGCGAGVSILTALLVAENILKGRRAL